MTAPQVPAQHSVLAAEPGSRLEQLAEAYALAKPAADAAKANLDSVIEAIKLELHNAAPDATKIDLNASALDVPLRLSSRTTWRLDSARLKAESPETYVRYAKQSSYWELRPVAKRGSS